MSNDPATLQESANGEPQASTSGSRAKESSDGAGATSQGAAGVSANGHSGTGEGAQDKNETPEELKSDLEMLRKELALQLQKKQSIDRQLVSHEAAIYAFETSYLSVDLSSGPTNATFGNIVKGYDSYLKAGSAAADAARKKQSTSSTRGGGVGYMTGVVGPSGAVYQPVMEEERLFSRSSGTYLDSLQMRERELNHFNSGGSGLPPGSPVTNTGNNTGSDIEELDDGDVPEGNESLSAAPTPGPAAGNANGTSTAGRADSGTPAEAAQSPAGISSAAGNKDRDRDSAAQRDAKRQKRK